MKKSIVFIFIFSMFILLTNVLAEQSFEGSDITITKMSIEAVKSVTLNGAALKPGTDYNTTNTQITLFKSMLSNSIKTGENQLEIFYDSGKKQAEIIDGLPSHNENIDRGAAQSSSIASTTSASSTNTSAAIESTSSENSTVSSDAKTADNTVIYAAIGLLVGLFIVAVMFLIISKKRRGK